MEEDKTLRPLFGKNEGGQCRFCGAKYGIEAKTANRCGHLLCEDIHDEGPFVYRGFANSPTTMNLMGVSIPTAVAYKFLNEFLDPENVQTIITEEWGGEHHVTYTYYLVHSPKHTMEALMPFVREHYADNKDPMEIDHEKIQEVSSSDNTVVYRLAVSRKEFKKQGLPLERWLMVTGLPDNLPDFVLFEPSKDFDRHRPDKLYLRDQGVLTAGVTLSVEVLKELPEIVTQ